MVTRFTHQDATHYGDDVAVSFGGSNQVTMQYISATGVFVIGSLTSTPVGWAVEHLTALGVGAKTGATVSVIEKGTPQIHQTVLTCAETPISVVGAAGVGFGGVKIYTFPEGRISVLGVTASLEVADLDSNLDDSADGGNYGIGTAIVSDADLGDATDVDLCPDTRIDPIGTAVGAALAASAQFDGTSAAKTVNINLLIDDEDIAATEVVGIVGTVTITWMNLGDF